MTMSCRLTLYAFSLFVLAILQTNAYADCEGLRILVKQDRNHAEPGEIITFEGQRIKNIDSDSSPKESDFDTWKWEITPAEIVNATAKLSDDASANYFILNSVGIYNSSTNAYDESRAYAIDITGKSVTLSNLAGKPTSIKGNLKRSGAYIVSAAISKNGNEIETVQCAVIVQKESAFWEYPELREDMDTENIIRMTILKRKELKELEKKEKIRSNSNDKKRINEIDKGLIDLEYILRKRARKLQGKKDSDVTDAEKKELSRIGNVVFFSDKYKTYEDYDSLYASFNAGYEYSNMKTIFKEGFPRVGLLISTRVPWNPASDYRDDDWRWPWWVEGILSVNLTSAITNTSAIDASITNSTTMENVRSQDNALDMDVSLFLPLLRTSTPDNFRHYLGPILSGGGYFVEKEETNESGGTKTAKTFNKYAYAGLRLGTNPEWYLDFLYGDADNLPGHQIVARGQMPVYPAGDKASIFLGIDLKFGIGLKDEEEGNDTLKVYATWNLDFLKLLGNSGNAR